jgi:predicted alpha/beta superfamily hydrolase
MRYAAGEWSLRRLVRIVMAFCFLSLVIGHASSTAAAQDSPLTVLCSGRPAVISIEPPRRMRAEGFAWDHEIQIALPASYRQSKKSYPVLWVTDGSWMFRPAACTAFNLNLSKHIPEMIVIAVGAPADAADDVLTRRLYDFTPTNDGPTFDGFGAYKTNPNMRLPKEFGGAPRFLSFLVDTVRSKLAKEYRMSGMHTLFGDSGGGIFCTYAFLARPAAFDNYICGSPSLNWGHQALFRLEDQYAQAHKDLPAQVFFGAGEAEILEDYDFAIVSSMTRMAEILQSRSYPSLKLHARIFSGEDHLSAVTMNLSWGLRTLWEGASAMGRQ